MVEPISDSQCLLVSQRTESYIARAEVLFDRSFARIPVMFDLRGTTAGMFRRHGKRCEIRYNPWIFGKYFPENLRDTVPHEVAHYIVYAVHGARHIKPHGTQWRDLMARFDADPGVTFDLDLEGVPRRRQRTHSYRCDCGLHALSTTRHNRVQWGRGSYQCRACHGLLVYTSC